MGNNESAADGPANRLEMGRFQVTMPDGQLIAVELFDIVNFENRPYTLLERCDELADEEGQCFIVMRFVHVDDKALEHIEPQAEYERVFAYCKDKIDKLYERDGLQVAWTLDDKRRLADFTDPESSSGKVRHIRLIEMRKAAEEKIEEDEKREH